jgi:hypothetical protein
VHITFDRGTLLLDDLPLELDDAGVPNADLPCPTLAPPSGFRPGEG